MQQTPEEIYRNYINDYVNRGIANLDRMLEDNHKIELASWQRSIEFFHLYQNKNVLIRNNALIRVLLLPPVALKFITLSSASKMISIIAFYLSVIVLSLVRMFKTSRMILSLPTKADLPYKPDGCVLLAMNTSSFNSETAGLYEFGPWLAKHYFKKPLKQLEIKCIDSRSCVSFCPLSLKFKIVLFGLWSVGCGVLGTIFFKWQRLYLVDDLMKSMLVKLLPVNALSKHFFLCYMGTPYRPLWTWHAEKRGSKIVHFFNSSSLEPSLNGKYHNNIFTGISTWPEIIPFSKEFSKQINAHLNYNTLVHNTPTIQIHDSSIFQLDKTNPLIGIFDTAPLNQSHYIGFSPWIEYFNTGSIDVDEFYERFYLDSLEAAEMIGAQLVTKPKRFADHRIKPSYIQLLEKLEQAGKIQVIPSPVSPYKVMDHCLMSIVQPFTSPGYYMEYHGDICFYEPVGILPKSHHNLHGRQLCHGNEELKRWVNHNFAKYKDAN